MESCSKCALYNERYDEFQKNHVDTEIRENPDLHFCCIYDESIPTDIVKDKEACDHMIKK